MINGVITPKVVITFQPELKPKSKKRVNCEKVLVASVLRMRNRRFQAQVKN